MKLLKIEDDKAIIVEVADCESEDNFFHFGEVELGDILADPMMVSDIIADSAIMIYHKQYSNHEINEPVCKLARDSYNTVKGPSLLYKLARINGTYLSTGFSNKEIAGLCNIMNVQLVT